MTIELEIFVIVLETIQAIGIMSLIFTIFEIRKGNDQRFRELLSEYLKSMRDTFQSRFESEDKADEMSYKTSLLTLDHCIFSVLSPKNKIKMKELADELSRVSHALYFGDLEEARSKIQWFKQEVFR